MPEPSRVARVPVVNPTPGDAIGEVAHNSAQSERTGNTLSEAEGSELATGQLWWTHSSFDAIEESAVGFKVIRKHIWLAAGHAHARQFQYWQEESKKATDEDDRELPPNTPHVPGGVHCASKEKGHRFPRFLISPRLSSLFSPFLAFPRLAPR